MRHTDLYGEKTLTSIYDQHKKTMRCYRNKQDIKKDNIREKILSTLIRLNYSHWILYSEMQINDTQIMIIYETIDGSRNYKYWECSYLCSSCNKVSGNHRVIEITANSQQNELYRFVNDRRLELETEKPVILADSQGWILVLHKDRDKRGFITNVMCEIMQGIDDDQKINILKNNYIVLYETMNQYLNIDQSDVLEYLAKLFEQ